MAEPETRLDIELNRAVKNSVRHAKRSLLDFVDLQMALHGENAHEIFWQSFKRRIHNDLSLVGDQVLASLQIYKNGGNIPAFGRTPEELAAVGRTDG